MKLKNILIVVVIIVVLFIIIGLIWGKDLLLKQTDLEDMEQKITDEIFIDILAHGFVWKNELIEENLYFSEEGKNIMSSKINTLLTEYDVTNEDILVYENMLNEKFENDQEYYEDITKRFEKRVAELESNEN